MMVEIAPIQVFLELVTTFYWIKLIVRLVFTYLLNKKYV